MAAEPDPPWVTQSVRARFGQNEGRTNDAKQDIAKADKSPANRTKRYKTGRTNGTK